MMHVSRAARLGVAAAAVLALGAGFVPGLMSSAAENPRPQRAQWEGEIRAFESSDKTNPPPAGAILFIGSSSIRLWKTLAEDFKGFPVLNRGFGGSQMADSVHYADRVVLPYRPRQIVVYAGDNDLASGKSPERVLLDFQAFAAKVHETLPKTRIAYISIKPCLSRWRLVDKVRRANSLIEQFARTDRRLSFIDIFTPMLGADGLPRGELFVDDQLHLNGKGYELWASTVRPFLMP